MAKASDILNKIGSAGPLGGVPTGLPKPGEAKGEGAHAEHHHKHDDASKPAAKGGKAKGGGGGSSARPKV